MSKTTKKAMASTLKRMMESTPFDKISVVNLVEECGINRQTFYYHFQNIYELLGWIYKNEALKKIKDYKSYDTWQEGLLIIFSYVKDNAKFCLNTFNSVGREHLNDFLYNITFKILVDIVKEITADKNIKEEELKFVADFYSFAVIGILTNWMKEGMKQEPKEIVNNVNKLIEGNADRILKNF
ncbi:TetR family transcriptional regulator [Vallitalea longa]|uniref:TetR family transcriptional regulator n=1 Tax=Vallitalea longa TaxID=2936439 RepID=A0A9W5YBN4_9FIRM|nr:dihydroxyacetone kinase transcriptional activator DhaS [Vallitalea longa]GKX29706.1 TetR family transcriptional regulator [Vallitalea longa]